MSNIIDFEVVVFIHINKQGEYSSHLVDMSEYQSLGVVCIQKVTKTIQVELPKPDMGLITKKFDDRISLVRAELEDTIMRLESEKQSYMAIRSDL